MSEAGMALARRICKIVIVLIVALCGGLGSFSLFFGKNNGGSDLAVGVGLLLMAPLTAGFLFSEELRGTARLKRLASIAAVGVAIELVVGLALRLAGLR